MSTKNPQVVSSIILPLPYVSFGLDSSELLKPAAPLTATEVVDLLGTIKEYPERWHQFPTLYLPCENLPSAWLTMWVHPSSQPHVAFDKIIYCLWWRDRLNQVHYNSVATWLNRSCSKVNQTWSRLVAKEDALALYRPYPLRRTA